MKKITFLLFVLFANTLFIYAQWQKVGLTKTGGGTIDPNMYQMALDNSKLYVATNDGIWESASANGSDWTPFGLQGKRVYLMNFAVLKLAITIETAVDNATLKTLQLYKYTGSAWVNTNFNPSKLAVFGTYAENLINFAQIQNNGKTVIVLPTWGNGIWNSQDGGDTWTVSPYETCTTCPDNTSLLHKKIPGIYTFPGDTKIYGIDKADFNMQFMIYSEDYGLTWKNKQVGNFFNPWALHKRMMKGASYFYWGGEDGNQGVVWRSGDGGTTWGDASITAGVDYWNTRRIIGDNDGPLYAMCSANNVYVSNDNGDTFTAVGTGLVISTIVPRYFLSHLVKSPTKLYVSTISDGMYSFALSTSEVKRINENKLKFSISSDKSMLTLHTELNSRISVLNMEGKLLKSIATFSEISNIDVRDLNSALYILKLQTADGEIQMGKFVK